MAKALGIIGKFLGGVSAVAVPAAMEEQRARIQTKRDAALMADRKAEAALDREARAADAAAGRAHQSAEGVLDRTQRSELSAAEIASAERRSTEQINVQREGIQATLEYQGMQYMANEADRKDRLRLLDKQLEGAQITNDLNALKLDQAQDLDAAYDIVNNPELSPEQRAAAAEYINLINPKSKSKFVFQQKKNEYDEPIDEWVVGNKETGEIWDAGKPAGRGARRGDSDDNDPLGLFK